MAHNFSRNAFFMYFPLMLVLWSIGGLAQEVRSAPVETGSSDLTIGITNADVLSSRPFLCIEDTAGLELMLIRATIGTQIIWTREGRTPAPQGAIQWAFDRESRQLLVDLSGISDQLTGTDLLSIAVVPVNTRRKEFMLSVFSAVSADGAARLARQPLSGVNFVKNASEQ